MKRRRIITAIAIVAAICLSLGGCMLPGDEPVDPLNPVIPADPVPAPITAAFSYYCDVFPIQTDSVVIFNGTDSASPDGEIVWGAWNFGDGDEQEGDWTAQGFWLWENGERQWTTIPWTGTEKVFHTYDDIGTYSVELTVWAIDDNSATTRRTVRVQEAL